MLALFFICWPYRLLFLTPSPPPFLSAKLVRSDKKSHHRFELFLYVLLEVIVELVPVLRPEDLSGFDFPCFSFYLPVDLLDVVQRVRVPPSKDANYVVDPDRWQSFGISDNFQNFGS